VDLYTIDILYIGRFGVGRDDVVQEKKRKLEAELE